MLNQKQKTKYHEPLKANPIIGMLKPSNGKLNFHIENENRNKFIPNKEIIN